MIRPKIYLAGPAVFATNAKDLAERNAALCRRMGYEPLHPLDNELQPDRFADSSEFATAIRTANEQMLRVCDGVVAELTPFRGPGMDGGTAYEIGFARALNKPVAGFLAPSYQTEYANRVREFFGLPAGTKVDPYGMTIEDFGQAENLMMATSLVFLGPTIEVALEGMSRHFASLRGLAPSPPAEPIP